ncbi:hypothetical protein BD310DRAFT_242132 [Dichomitus squalens]|uniref:Secreted protein n=1 Tax=Dichomitus squalens TaxID=114155 RepID=A0A4V2K6I8_9APHY|nr:hypothetical protein BD310DRAFT_242132 [Dichomitus squalens]
MLKLLLYRILAITVHHFWLSLDANRCAYADASAETHRANNMARLYHLFIGGWGERAYRPAALSRRGVLSEGGRGAREECHAVRNRRKPTESLSLRRVCESLAGGSFARPISSHIWDSRECTRVMISNTSQPDVHYWWVLRRFLMPTA